MGLFSAVNSIFRAVETAAYVVEATAHAAAVVAEAGVKSASLLNVQAALRLCEELGIEPSSQEEAIEIANQWSKLSKPVEEQTRRKAIPAVKVINP